MHIEREWGEKEWQCGPWLTGDGARYPEWRHNLTVFAASVPNANASAAAAVPWRPYLTLEQGFAAYSTMLSAAQEPIAPTAPAQIHVAYESGNESAMQGMYDPKLASPLSAISFKTFAAPHVPSKADDLAAADARQVFLWLNPEWMNMSWHGQTLNTSWQIDGRPIIDGIYLMCGPSFAVQHGVAVITMNETDYELKCGEYVASPRD
jgi:hypothetical protein